MKRSHGVSSASSVRSNVAIAIPIRAAVIASSPKASANSSGYPGSLSSTAATSAGWSLASAQGTASSSFAVTVSHSMSMCAISISETIGPTAWLSSAPPLAITVSPVSGSSNRLVARPSQNNSSANIAMIEGFAARPVSCRSSPKIGSGSYDEAASARITPGDVFRSSAFPSTPSGPGCTASLGSAPPAAGI